MMDFDRAMNVRVNGKDVNRLALNGVTIWEKYAPASILLESDKSYASEGDTLTLTATVYDKFGRGSPDKTVEFINNDTSELIATATTNSNGIASVSYLVKDTNPLNIKAKTNNIESNLITLRNILWQPALNGETGAEYVWSYSESNGEAIGKGFILNGGWSNEGLWEATFEFKHDNIRYTGIAFIGVGFNPINKYFIGLGSWEGSWPGGTAYASFNSGTVGWFDVTVTKIDDTHVRLRSEILNRDTTVEYPSLATLESVSIGANHNASSSSFGPCRIRNVKVIAI